MNPLRFVRLGAGVALLAWLWLGWGAAARRADRLDDQLRQERARTIAAERRIAAMARAEVERAADDRHLDSMRKDLTDAIAAVPPGGAPDAASVALGCARLRRAGRTDAAAYRRLCG